MKIPLFVALKGVNGFWCFWRRDRAFSLGIAPGGLTRFVISASIPLNFVLLVSASRPVWIRDGFRIFTRGMHKLLKVYLKWTRRGTVSGYGWLADS